MKNGYDFFFDTPYGLIVFPITPSTLKMKNGSKNTTVTLINEGDINILKAPALTEIEFEARFPMSKYPFSREPEAFQTYFEIFAKLKEEKKPFRFIVARQNFGGERSWDTNTLVSLEKLTTDESASNGDDVILSFTLKQYREYGTKKLQTSSSDKTPATTSTADKPRASTKDTSQQNYTVVSGDCLWNIAKKYYGDGSRWKEIYNANKSTIENAAKKYGKASSSNGHWIYPGTKLVIPAK